MKFLQTVLLSSIFIPLKPVIVSAQKPDLEARLNSFHAAIDAEWQYRLKTHPEMAAYVGDARYNDRLTNFSAEAIAREEKEDKRELALFTAIDSSGFPPEDVLNKQLMIRTLRQPIEGAPFKEWEMPVNQMNGIRTFHDAVLEEGPLPLDVLEDHVRMWIVQQKSSAPALQ